jgi:hypothetical protein
MMAALVCLSCQHWALSYRDATAEKMDIVKDFYCEECREPRKVIYKGLVEPLPIKK